MSYMVFIHGLENYFYFTF